MNFLITTMNSVLGAWLQYKLENIKDQIYVKRTFVETFEGIKTTMSKKLKFIEYL